MDKLPDWVNDFNKKGLAKKYLTGKWNTLLPIEQYTESGPDDSPYEANIGMKDKPVFPYDLTAIREKDKDFGFLPRRGISNRVR